MITIPEELQIYLRDVDAILRDTRTTKDIEAITQNIAKFQYYLRGRLDQIDITSKGMQGEVTFKRITVTLKNQSESAKQISEQLGVLLFAISDKLMEIGLKLTNDGTDNNSGGKAT